VHKTFPNWVGWLATPGARYGVGHVTRLVSRTLFQNTVQLYRYPLDVKRQQRQRNETATGKRNAKSSHTKTIAHLRSGEVLFFPSTTSISSTATNSWQWQIQEYISTTKSSYPSMNHHTCQCYSIYFSLFPLLIPVLTKERQTPVAHGLHVSDSFTLPLTSTFSTFLTTPPADTSIQSSLAFLQCFPKAQTHPQYQSAFPEATRTTEELS